jgi:hypothetical protein
MKGKPEFNQVEKAYRVLSASTTNVRVFVKTYRGTY